jgi:protein SCO1
MRLARFTPVACLLGAFFLATVTASAGGCEQRDPRVALALEESLYRNFVGLHMTDQRGRPLDVGGLAGKVVLLSFIFTSCPTVCPMQTSALVSVQRGLTREERGAVHFLSISVDPTDTPAMLHEFARSHGAETLPWSFVSMPDADLRVLGARLPIFAAGSAGVPSAHSTGLWLIDAQGRLLQRYDANPPEVPRLVRELKTLTSGALAR